MKINWKVRIKNPTFWLTVIPATVSFVYTVLMLFGVTPAISESAMINGLAAIVTGLTAIGVLVDPTTAGVSDSKQAMTYTQPKGDEEDGN